MLRKSLTALLSAVLILGTSLAQAAPLPEGKPQDVGLSAERLDRITTTMQAAVDSGEIPGAVVMVARKGKLVYQRAFGKQDQAKGTTMSTDSIFRIFSMTKPIVSAAALILLEEGKLGLHEPVSKFIPEFKEMRVAVETFDSVSGAQSFHTTAARRQITVQDLMRHTSGLTYGVFLPKTNQLGNLYRDAKPFGATTLEEFCRIIAKLPLRFEPGTTWEYSHSTDVLGRVIEVASGRPLDVFVAERILKPLKMNDTDWYVPADKVARFAQPMPGREKDWFPELMFDFTKPATFFAGGHGLVSTPGDYLRFAQMLANGGELDGVRILGSRTIAYAASDHVLAAGLSKGLNWLPGAGYGFGLGFGVRKEQGASEWNGSIGDFFWGGYAGTYFWVDPKEELVPVIMMQEVARRNHYRILLRDLVYQAIVQ